MLKFNVYGDYLFETMKVVDSAIPLLSHHLARLDRSSLLLKFPQLSMENIANSCHEMLEKEDIIEGVMRLAVYRGYPKYGNLISNKDSEYHVECEVLKQDSCVDRHTLLLSPYRIMSNRILNNLKHGNRLDYTLASLYTNDSRQNDIEILLLDSMGHVVDCLHHSILWRIGESLYTPSLITGCLDSIARNIIIKQCSLPVYFVTASCNELHEADELLLCNAVQGVCSVARFGKTIYNDFSLYTSLKSYFKTILR